ncbi:hypothetical protein L6164_012623 [Bauhinia variegata]|uniref:Uncharacterized protein n=1 Tax=Bauhinia variegata TaxID=167791 RepID=A0ACB9P9N0_BAUVA|nr:hypothetical protein L6164_012623 [Bauhinia variegata]
MAKGALVKEMGLMRMVGEEVNINKQSTERVEVKLTKGGRVVGAFWAWSGCGTCDYKGTMAVSVPEEWCSVIGPRHWKSLRIDS